MWIAGRPYHPGGLWDLALRDLLNLDRFLAVYQGGLRHWWEIPAAAEDHDSMPAELRQYHPESALLLAVWVWGTMRRNGETASLDEVLDSGLEVDEVWIDREPGDSPESESLPRGFRSSIVEQDAPDVVGMDLQREVARRLLGAMVHLHLKPADVWALPLGVWLGVAAQIDALSKG